MQLSVLLPVLALIAAPLAEARDGNRHATRELGRHAKHARAAERLSHAMERRDQLARSNPTAVRRVKRASKTCRVRESGSSSAAAASATSAAASASSADASASATSVDPASSTTAPAASSAAASDAASSDSAAASSTSAADASASASSTSSAATSSSTTSSSGLTPRGKKAGTSGTETVEAFKDHISWYWNYGSTSDMDDPPVTFVPTVWGDGSQGSQDSSRLASFKAITTVPEYIQGFYEPDCSPPMSSAIDPTVAAPLWNSLIAPYKSKGSILVSPGLCKQADEDWLTPFKNLIGDDNMWDVTSIHINKLDMDGVRKDIDHYWNTYGKPIWVTEFACVDDSNGAFNPCTDQNQINTYINEIVPLFESDSRIYAYSISTGEGLGDVWPSWSNNALTETGQTYLNAISKY